MGAHFFLNTPKSSNQVSKLTMLSVVTGPPDITLNLNFQGQILKKLYLRNGMADWHGTKGRVDRMLDSRCESLTSPMTSTLDLQGKILKLLYLRNGRVDSLGMKGVWVGYNVGCTMGLTLGHGACQIDRPSNGSMWNSCSFQPLGQWMGYSFTDLRAEGCCHSLNALFCIRSVSVELLESDVAVISSICGRILNHFASWVQPYFDVHIPLEENLPIIRSWFAAEQSQSLGTRWGM